MRITISSPWCADSTHPSRKNLSILAAVISIQKSFAVWLGPSRTSKTASWQAVTSRATRSRTTLVRNAGVAWSWLHGLARCPWSRRSLRKVDTKVEERQERETMNRPEKMIMTSKTMMKMMKIARIVSTRGATIFGRLSELLRTEEIMTS